MSEKSPWIPVSKLLPKPGEHVLAAYRNSAGKWRTVCAFWIPEKFLEAEWDSEADTEYDEKSDRYYHPPGWYEVLDNWDDYGFLVIHAGEVSHWTPKPRPPSGEEQDVPDIQRKMAQARAMLQQAAKQFRLIGYDGHAAMCERHAEELA